MSKGSRDRVTDKKKFDENYGRIDWQSHGVTGPMRFNFIRAGFRLVDGKDAAMEWYQEESYPRG